jgi:hypothetical protein
LRINHLQEVPVPEDGKLRLKVFDTKKLRALVEGKFEDWEA